MRKFFAHPTNPVAKIVAVFLIVKDGFSKNEKQAFKCKICAKKFTIKKKSKKLELYNSYIKEKKYLPPSKR